MGPTFCPEMPVTYYQSTLRKILENRIQQQQETVFSTDRGLVLELGTCHCKPRGITALFSRTSCINEESARFEHCWSSACLLLQPGRIVCQYNTESSIGLATCNYMQAGVRRHLILEETMERSWHSTYTGPPPPHPAPQVIVSMDTASVMIYNQQQCTVFERQLLPLQNRKYNLSSWFFILVFSSLLCGIIRYLVYFLGYWTCY